MILGGNHASTGYYSLLKCTLRKSEYIVSTLVLFGPMKQEHSTTQVVPGDLERVISSKDFYAYKMLQQQV